MSLPLKIKIQRTDQTKVMKFVPTMSVAEALRSIQEKGIEGGADHGLFQPAGPKNPARWLKLERTLQYYDLLPNDELEYKKRHRPLKIKLIDETIKTILVDDTLTVGDIVNVIGEKMSISNAEEFSLKAEGKSDWLNSTQSLHEQGVGEDAVLLFQKKYFVSDSNVSTDDPVALHLVYIQSRDAILAGHHPCTLDEALNFAALQCQILYGSYDPTKNRKIELEKVLAPTFRKDKKVEEKIIKEHKKLTGMSEVNAKYRFVQLCRSLRTYGITFFACKLKIKDKKFKGINLGVTRDSVIFMDDETKEITKESPIIHLRRWAAAPTTFTLDFGDHEKEYMVLHTTEGDAISSLLSGYIDILLKKQKSGAVVLNDDGSERADIEPIVSPVSSAALTSVTMATIKGYAPGTLRQDSMGGSASSYSRMMGTYSSMTAPTNLASAQSMVGTIVSDLRSGNPYNRNTGLTTQQWRSQLISNTNAVISSVAKLNATLPPNQFDRAGMDNKAAEIAANLAQLISAAKNAAVKPNGDDDVNLLNGAKMVADAIKDLLAASKDLSDKPNDAKALERYNAAQKALQAATAYLLAANKGNLSDDSSQNLMLQSAKNVAACIEDLLNSARNRNEPGVASAGENTKRANEDLQGTVLSVAPAILDATCLTQLQQACKALEGSVATYVQTAKTSGDNTGLMLAAKDIGDAIAQLLNSSAIAEPSNLVPDYTNSAKDILEELAKMSGAQGNSALIDSGLKTVTALSQKIAKDATSAAAFLDPESKERLLSAVKALAAATQKLVMTGKTASDNPNDRNAHRQLQESCQRMGEATRALVGDAIEQAAMRNLRAAAKQAAAATTGLVSAAKVSSATCSDPVTADGLKGASKGASESIANLVKALTLAYKNLSDPEAQSSLLREATSCTPQAFKLVALAKSATPNITDATNKNNLRQAASDAAEALQKLLEASKSVVVSSGQATIDSALEKLSAEESHLDSALVDIDTGTLMTDPNQTPDGAAQLLNLAAKQVAGATKTLATVAKSNPDELGNASLGLADAVQQLNTAAKVLSSTIPEKPIQRSIVKSAKELTVQSRNAITSSRAVASNPADPSLNGMLAQSAKNLAEALAALLAAAKGTQSGGRECDEAVATIATALKSLGPKQANTKDYPIFAEELENAIKALQSATLALVSAAKNNPKSLGGAAKSTALTVPPLVAAASQAAGSSGNADTQKNIMSATSTTAGAVSNLINTAKATAGKSDPASLESLNNASSAVNTALEQLLGAINSTPAQKQFNDSIEEILRATTRLAEAPPGVSGDLSSAIEALKGGTTKLGEATKGIISSSRSEPEQMGPHSRHAASAISQIVGASIALSNSSKQSVYTDDVNKVKEAAEDLVNACQTQDLATAKPQIIKSAKDLTVAAQGLAEGLRRDIMASDSPQVQDLLSQFSQSVPTATSSLVNSAKAAISNQPGAKETLADNFEQLNQTLDALLNDDPNKVPSSKSKKLMSVAREAASATTNMIELSKNVHKRPTDTDAISDLSQSARAVGNAIKGLLDAAKSIGEIDLDDAINKISQSISELDSASISATVGLLENIAPPGKTTQNLEEDLVEIAKKLAGSIKNLTAEKDSPVQLAKAAKVTAYTIPELALTAMQLAGVASDPEAQQNALSLAKGIADTTLLLVNACKQNDVKEIVTQAKEASQAIVKMLGTLKGGVIALRDCDEAVKTIVDTVKSLDGYNLNGPVDPSRSYADSQRELTNLAKSLVGSIASTVNAAKSKPHEVGEQAKKVAAITPSFCNNLLDALDATSQKDVRDALLKSGKNVTNALEKLIKTCKVVASDPKNAKSQQLLSAANKEVTESISSLVVAIKSGATGEIKCEEAVDSINRRIGELDSAALFAATGQLQADSEDVDLDQVQEELSEACKKVNSSVQALVSAADKNQNDLGNAASDAMDAFEKVAKDAKTIASQLTNLLTQQELLMNAKGVGITVQLAVTNGLNVHKQPSAESRKQLAESSTRVNDAIKELLSTASSAAASSGIKDLDAARKGVIRVIETFSSVTPNNKAGATDVLRSAKGITDSVVNIYTTVQSLDSDEVTKLIQACQELTKSATGIVENSKGAVRLTDQQSGDKLLEAVQKALESTSLFLGAAKSHKKSPTGESLRQISEANDNLVKMIGEVVEAARPLPGSEEALKLFQEADELESLAEQELMACANTISDAARIIEDAKRRQIEMRKNKDSPLPDEEITEAILDACKAIANATGVLVSASSAAQKEIVSKGRAVKSQNLYKRDPAWSKGLISAAQSVAGSVKTLVNAANNTAQGRMEEEMLISSARGVAGSTARLVFASRTKAADPMSQTQQKLSVAAKSVASATKQLVDAAKSAAEVQKEQEEKVSYEGVGENERTKMQLEQQAKILKLQKELESAQTTLGKMRKEEYADAGAASKPAARPPRNPVPQQADQPATAASAKPKPAVPSRITGTATKKAGVARVLPGEKFYTLEELQQRPPECDPTQLEKYLSDEEFQKHFNIDKANFAKAPVWKQTQAKKTLGIH